jgi:hypothetical protein
MAEPKNPFAEGTTGQNAFREAYNRLKEQSSASRQNITQDYANTYQNLRNQSFAQGLGAAAQRGLSGGQAAGASQQISAQQMGALGNLMQGQERALRDQGLQESSIYSNALLEGQQAQQMDREEREYQFSVEQRIAAINADKTLSPEQKERQIFQLTQNAPRAGEVSGMASQRQGDVGPFGANANKIERQVRRGEISYDRAFALLRAETAFGGGRKYTDEQIRNRLMR